MPIVDGWMFCKIRQGIVALMEIPVIAISAASMTGTHEPLQVDGRIEKPFEADALIRIVTLMVERRSVRGSLCWRRCDGLKAQDREEPAAVAASARAPRARAPERESGPLRTRGSGGA